MIRRPPSSPLFPSTPLSRSRAIPGARQCACHDTVFVAADAGPVTDGTGRCPLTAGVSAGIDMALTLLARIHGPQRSEEHTSELQSQSISYAVFCFKKKKLRQHDVSYQFREAAADATVCTSVLLLIVVIQFAVSRDILLVHATTTDRSRTQFTRSRLP